MPRSDRPVALVTGARRGIGRHLAECYLRRGWVVAGCALHTSDLSDDHYADFPLDVADEAAVVAMFADITRRFGRLDYLVNSAGVASMNHAMLTPTASAESLLRTNVLGTFVLCREGAKLMRRARAGRIVNLSSVAVPLRLEGEAMYAASKAAVETFTRVFAREVAPFGISCNAVGPGPVATALIAGVPDEMLRTLVERQAVRAMATVDDVRAAVDLFLLAEGAQITGQVVYLGGVG